MMSELFYPSYTHLFVLSFLASTILPIGSEWLLIVMIMKGFSPSYCVGIASIGNFLGGFVTMLMGRFGADYLIHRLLRIDETQLKRSRRIYERYGSWSLLLSWVPIVGDPLCLIAGIFRMNMARFSILVFVGKCARYTVLTVLFLEAAG